MKIDKSIIKKNERHLGWKEVIWFLFSDDTIIYIEKSQEVYIKSYKNNEFNKIVEYKSA